MPPLSRWFIRAALIYFLTGFTLGALILSHKGIGLHPALWAWLPVHIEFLLLGWIVQVAMGMGFWILPRFWKPPRRPNTGLAMAAFYLLNGGIALVAVESFWDSGFYLDIIGRAAELLAVVSFAGHAWGRIVSREGR